MEGLNAMLVVRLKILREVDGIGSQICEVLHRELILRVHEDANIIDIKNRRRTVGPQDIQTRTGLPLEGCIQYRYLGGGEWCDRSEIGKVNIVQDCGYHSE